MTQLSLNRSGKNFISDNTAPMDPAVLEALISANQQHATPYGEDDLTAHLEETLSAFFDTKLKVVPVATGTAANALALSALTSPFGAILCDKAAHIDNDEAGAPEFYTGGAKLLPIASKDGKIQPEMLEEAILKNRAKGVLAPPAQVLSLSQTTECGTVYTPKELQTLLEIARKYGLKTHLDGARIGNAAAFLEKPLKTFTADLGLDILVFGLGKAGAMAAELVVVFETPRTESALNALSHLHKRSGQTWSKGRFLAVQALSMLEEDRWLVNSRHANTMAKTLSEGLKKQLKQGKLELFFPYKVEANEIFLIAPAALWDCLAQKGFSFYRFPVAETLKDDIPSFENPETARFVTSFYTKEEDITALLEAFRQL